MASSALSPAPEIRGHVAVVGLGYIGLPTAVVLALAGWDVTGVDIAKKTVKRVNQGRLPFSEPGLDKALGEAIETGRLRASLDMVHADTYIISVPTPIDEDNHPDLSAIEAAVSAIVPHLVGGELIIVESTIPPGTTQRTAEFVLNQRPDLSLDGSKGRPEIHFAHVPERVLPGRIMEEIHTNDRVIGGVTGRAAALAEAMYSTICTGTIHLTDAPSAELCKLAENAFRDVNIAYANELSLICDRLGIDVWELISLANLHPRVNILNPGPGVGGHCIAVDPWFIVDADPTNARLIRAARKVNDFKPTWVVDKAREKLEESDTDTVIVFGLAFKPDVDDLRESPAVRIAQRFAQLPEVKNVLAVEPNISKLPKSLADNPKVSLLPIDEALDENGVIVLAVPHKEFRQLPLASYEGHDIIDACGIFSCTSQA